MKNLKTKSIALDELLRIDEFYEDLIGYFPDQISKNVSKFNDFFSGVAKDRDRYYVELIGEIKSDLKFLKSENTQLDPELKELAIQFKSTSVLKDLSLLTSAEERIRQELRTLDDLKTLLLECENIEDKISDLEGLKTDAIDRGRKASRKSREVRMKIINLFHELIGEIYETDEGVLEFDYISNPSSNIVGRTDVVCTIPSQGSHGRTYAKINIFDFVWFLKEREEGEFDPGFLIHDGSYVKISKLVKLKMLEAITKRLGAKQYITTFNEGEIDMSPEFEKSVCCVLNGSSVDGKLFKEQFE